LGRNLLFMIPFMINKLANNQIESTCTGKWLSIIFLLLFKLKKNNTPMEINPNQPYRYDFDE